MNVFAYQRAIRASNLNSTERLVLLTLTTWASGSAPWSVWPSNEELAEACALSEKTLKRALKSLADAGWLERSRTLTQRSLTLTLGQGQNFPIERGKNDPIDGDKTSPTGRVKMSPSKGTKLPHRWGQNDPPTSNVEETMHETMHETNEETREKKSPALRSAAHTPAQGKAQAGAGSLSLSKCWGDLWGGGAPCPPALLHLERSRGLDAALTALAWLLHRRASEGVKSPGRVAQYLAEDFATGRRDARKWTAQELEAVREGAYPGDFWAQEEEVAKEPPREEEPMISEEARQRLLERMRAAREAFLAPERRGL